MAKTVKTTEAIDWQQSLRHFIENYCATNKRGDARYIGLRFGQISGIDPVASKVQGKPVYIDFLDGLVTDVQAGVIKNLAITKENKIADKQGNEFTRKLALEYMETQMGMAIVKGPKGGFQYASMPVKGQNGAVVVVKAGKPKISRY